MARGGGNDGDDWYQANRNLQNCSAFCTSVMQTGGVANSPVPNFSGENPYHVKCFDGFSLTPLNSIRIAFVSQLGTTQVDPSLPQVDTFTNVTFCLRMIEFNFKF